MSTCTSADAEQGHRISAAPHAMPRRESRVFRDTIDRAELKAELGDISERTIMRLEKAGMPFIAVGHIRRYEPEKVRAWFLKHQSIPATPRRGRPRKVA